ncbi:MAG: nucleotide exchange factor GrpE [Saccharofermentanales bacterium]|jgi:molecular chaperone GrpE|nr:nucleotide exchange factor GrpE [Clostridiaceae bacterium]
MKKNKGPGHGESAVPPADDAGHVESIAEKDPAAEASEQTAVDQQVAQLKEALALKEKDFDILSEKYLRLAAEYDNFRKRSQKEKEAVYSDAVVAIVKDILPVIDNIERAGRSAALYETEEARKVAEGVEMIQRQVEQMLERLCVSKIDCVGESFDPILHEAVMHIQDDDAGPSTVVEELEAGYRREDRVIRYSKVKVAN